MERSKAIVAVAWSVMLCGQVLAQEVPECKIYAPTALEFIEDVEQSDTVFVGRIAGFRMDDTTLVTVVPDCPVLGGTGASEECAAFWDRVVTLRYLIEAPIRGVDDQRYFETTSVSTTDPCQTVGIGQLWLVSGYWSQRIQLSEMPSMAVLASLRQRAKD